MKNTFLYNKYLLVEGKSEKTINLYMYYLKKFDIWYEANYSKPMDFLDREVVIYYLNNLALKLSSKSLNSQVNFFRSYNAHLISVGAQSEMVIDLKMRINIPKKKEIPKELNEKFVEDLLQNVYNSDGIKNFTMLYTIAYSGIRPIELVELRLKDINLVDRVIYIKGRYNREVPIDSKLINNLKLYLRDVDKLQEYLFINERDTPYTERGIQWLFRKYCSDTKLSLNALREFHKSMLFKQGYSPKEVDEMLGFSTDKKSYINSNFQEMLTPAQFAKEFNVTAQAVRKWCNNGLVRVYKTDKGFRRIPYSEVERFKDSAYPRHIKKRS